MPAEEVRAIVPTAGNDRFPRNTPLSQEQAAPMRQPAAPYGTIR